MMTPIDVAVDPMLGLLIVHAIVALYVVVVL